MFDFGSPIGINYGGSFGQVPPSIFGTTPVGIGPGSGGFVPGAAPGFTPSTAPLSGRTIRTIGDIANIFTQFGAGYRQFAGGQDTIILAPSQGPSGFAPGGAQASVLGGTVVPLLLVGGIALVAVLAFSKKK